MRHRLAPLLALAACALALSALATCNHSSDSTPTATLELQVISPHGSDIKREFLDAFSKWHQQHFGNPVHITYPDIGGGGTSNIVKQLNAAYAYRSTCDFDVAFGGGSAAFNDYAQNNFLVPLPPVTAEELRQANWPSDPIDAVPMDSNPPAESDRGLRDAHGLWVAATMSAFGIEINKDRIADLHLQTPRAWADIARPEWFGQLSLADPSKSGSVKTSYEMLLQQHGWEEGWGLLVKLFANASMIREAGSNPADDVASADAVAGICIDFFGRLQISRVGQRIVSFVIPENGTSLDADPIAMLKGAPHPELAARFVRFVVSPEGQRLWVDRPGTPGGPQKTALGRLSVLPDVYKSDAAYLVDPNSPFDAAVRKADQTKVQSRNAYLGDIIKASLVDNYPALVRTRKAILNAGDPPELLAALTSVPVYQTASIQSGSLTYSESKPLAKDDDLATLAKTFAPPKGDPLNGESDKIQSHLKDLWRDDFANRLTQLESAAKAIKR